MTFIKCFICTYDFRADWLGQPGNGQEPNLQEPQACPSCRSVMSNG